MVDSALSIALQNSGYLVWAQSGERANSAGVMKLLLLKELHHVKKNSDNLYGMDYQCGNDLLNGVFVRSGSSGYSLHYLDCFDLCGCVRKGLPASQKGKAAKDSRIVGLGVMNRTDYTYG
jgi:hypothetical protein